ncbi:hypothetical protein J6590_026514 [Homalodisca vitripennis]|nr:hypothetical protein J6590_026514 [Homalodisca vitripennis]
MLDDANNVFEAQDEGNDNTTLQLGRKQPSLSSRLQPGNQPISLSPIKRQLGAHVNPSRSWIKCPSHPDFYTRLEQLVELNELIYSQYLARGSDAAESPLSPLHRRPRSLNAPAALPPPGCPQDLLFESILLPLEDHRVRTGWHITFGSGLILLQDACILPAAHTFIDPTRGVAALPSHVVITICYWADRPSLGALLPEYSYFVCHY